jgi:hypothetical protein
MREPTPVPTRRELDAAIEELRGKGTGFRYSDLARLLHRCKFLERGSGTSHRTWSHALLDHHVTIKDDGRRHLLPVYVKRVSAVLRRLRETLYPGEA